MNNVIRGPINRWRGLVFLCLSLLVISLDNTVVNVALPSISNQLGGSDTDLQWIVAAYILVFAALLLTMGTLGDRIGRKRVLQFGLLWFGAGSLLAALSLSTDMLILSSALLGVGGAMIMPSTLSLISATFLDQKERFQAIAIWGAMFAVGDALGVVVLGSIMNSVYLSQITRLRYAPQLAHVPAQVFDATSLGIQEAHVAAHGIADPRIAQMVTDAANGAFVSGMAEAMLVGAVILAVAAVLTFVVLPVKVRHAADDTTMPETTGDRPEKDEKSEVMAP